jgi:hypothetical protein
MRTRLSSLAAAAFLATGASLFSGYASALPVADATAVENSTITSNVESVRWHHRGWGFGAGLLGGAIIGGALASPYYYGGPGPYYYGGPGPYYYGPPAAPVYGPGPRGDAEDYCLSRYRSYDVRSGTFLGNDGYRHPCP